MLADAPQFFRATYQRLCHGNPYPATIHLFLQRLIRRTFEECDALLAMHKVGLKKWGLLDTFNSILSSSVKRLHIVEEGLTCDPMRWLTWLETGVPTKGFIPFSKEALSWWVKAGCKAPWLTQIVKGWVVGELDFGVSRDGAKALSKVACAMLKEMIQQKDELPQGFRALIRRLDPEEEAE